MSDRFDSSALDLIDRADDFAPTMSVEPDAVIAAGRRKARRRRTSAAGGVGALALVGALWLGGPLNPLAPDGLTGAPVPASISWQEGVDAELFDNVPHPVHEVDRTHWTGHLRSGEGDALPELVLTRDGEQLDPVAAQDGWRDVMVFQVEGLSVAVWQSPAGSLGEQLQWAPGVFASQSGTITVDGSELMYSAAEIVPGATGELEELYWFTDDAAHAASGAPVASTVLAAGGTRALVMVDEARQVWGMRDLAAPAGLLHVERLVADAGLSGWTGEEVVGTSVGVLPAGASAPTVEAETATLVHAPLGSRTAVMAVDTTGQTYGEPGTTVIGSDGTSVTYAPPPTISFTLDDEEHVLESYAQDYGRTLDVGSVQIMVTAQPDALELRRGEQRALIPAGDLRDGRAFAAPVMGGQAVVVPGWVPDAVPEDLRVLVGTDGDERWVEAKSAYVDALFDGRPLVVLGLDRGVVEEGETVRGVGQVDGGDIAPHELKDGVVRLDVDL